MMNDKMRLNFRLIAGLYLIYLTYTLIKNWSSNTSSRILAAVCIILFGVIGILLTIMSGMQLIKKKKDEKKD